MTKKKQKSSVAKQIMKLDDFLKKPKTAEEIKRELKDRFGHNEKIVDVRVNLLYLLRREKIKRKIENKIYNYYI